MIEELVQTLKASSALIYLTDTNMLHLATEGSHEQLVYYKLVATGCEGLHHGRILVINWNIELTSMDYFTAPNVVNLKFLRHVNL